MSTKNTTATATETVTKRPVGRPASFPGQPTKMFAANIPVTTSQGLVALAKQRSIPVNVLVNRIAEQAVARAAKDAARRAAPKGK